MKEKEQVLLYACFTNWTTFDLIYSMTTLCFSSAINSPVKGEGVCMYKKGVKIWQIFNEILKEKKNKLKLIYMYFKKTSEY